MHTPPSTTLVLLRSHGHKQEVKRRDPMLKEEDDEFVIISGDDAHDASHTPNSVVSASTGNSTPIRLTTPEREEDVLLATDPFPTPKREGIDNVRKPPISQKLPSTASTTRITTSSSSSCGLSGDGDPIHDRYQMATTPDHTDCDVPPPPPIATTEERPRPLPMSPLIPCNATSFDSIPPPPPLPPSLSPPPLSLPQFPSKTAPKMMSNANDRNHSITHYLEHDESDRTASHRAICTIPTTCSLDKTRFCRF